MQLVSTLLYAASSLVLGVGGVMHAMAFFAFAQTRISQANQAGVFAQEMKVLWLADSTTLIAVAVIVAYLAIRRNNASRAVTLLLALIPAATAGLLYAFLGPFFAAHLLMLAVAMLVFGALVSPAHVQANTGTS